ncbi:MAG TPA: hydrogenase maturation protease [Bryobacteraceae bacterium]|nr:hydrogenase maturation protease [Bryobacteraceae bacterium]HOL72435.1 hydrogenase maturation protease [Bryobacteraceae bacterium]HOQ44850.1 hydrogenase maturation protease [Bryobacteraceae bacterium]HPQ17533.1 hydrogenase maturation protease [Bryobacteraceae bacterium]HPU72139.1 hydrogenase maturation protease [Bryobacteraceae bacterium]
MGKPLIIGCGNPDRGDDAAGLLVVKRLRSMGIAAEEHSGEGLALMEAWSGAGSVILIDAVVTGAAPGAISVWDARTAPVSRGAFRASTHSFGAAEAVELARALDRLPASLTIYGIEGKNFERGARPAPEVLAAVEEVAQRIAEQVQSITKEVEG